MRKLMIFTGTLSHGGSERVISILSKEFLTAFDQVEIVLYYDKPIWYNIDKNVKITIIDQVMTKGKGMVAKALWFRKYIMKNSPDVVISFLAPFNMFTIISLLGNSTPIVVAERNDPRYIPSKFYLRGLRNMIYCLADRIIVQTENNKRYFSEYLQHKCDVIYNPVFLKEETGIALRTEKQKKIVTVGRLIAQKNQKMLIEAFSQIHQEYPEYNLVIYGEGNLHYELDKQIAELGLTDVVELAGTKQDVCKYILDSKLFVLTSEFEGMPNALIEAMCLGLPCISTKVSGAVDLIQHGENGLLVEKGDIAGIIDLIRNVLDNKKYSAILGKNASLLQEKLCTDKIVKQWIEMIYKILEA